MKSYNWIPLFHVDAFPVYCQCINGLNSNNDNINIQVEFIFEDIITLFATKHIQPLKYYIKTN